MTQFYVNAARETMAHALPDARVWESEVWDVECSRGCGDFELCAEEATAIGPDCLCPSCRYNSGIGTATGKTAYWYEFGFPGCMPEGEARGPFDSEAEAIEDARETGGMYGADEA